MAHAYTPGLKVSRRTVVIKERKLPIEGEVVVEVGQMVSMDDIVAKTELPGSVEMVNVANILGVEPELVPKYMLKKEGERVEQGELIALHKAFLGLFRTEVRSPITGTVESISPATGQVILRRPPVPITVDAYIDGQVCEVHPKEGVSIRTYGTFIQGIFGVGGERKGNLRVIVSSPDEIADLRALTDDLEGSIVVAGSYVSYEFITKAVEVGVKGIIVGGIDDYDLSKFLGYDIGVAVTGTEDIPLTLILTEGFGRIRMAEKTFRLLKESDGRKVSINGATQIRAGVIRPEIIIPYLEEVKDFREVEREEISLGLEVGAKVRIIREPNFGKLARVIALPEQPQVIPTSSKVRVVELELLDTGERVIYPRANIELFEED